MAGFFDNFEKGKDDECWIWSGTISYAGYGLYRLSGKQYRAHRLMYEHANKRRLKDDECVCHTCDNPSCVNPDHLFVGSHDDNMADMVEKGRARNKYTGKLES